MTTRALQHGTRRNETQDTLGKHRIPREIQETDERDESTDKTKSKTEDKTDS